MLKDATRRRLHVYLLTAVIALTATGIGIAINLQIKNLLARNLLNEYAKQEALVAEQVAQNLQVNISSVQEKLELLASFPEVMSAQPAPCEKKLNEAFHIMERRIGNLGRVNRDRVFACSINRSLVGVKADTLGPYIAQIFDDPEHKPVLSRAIWVQGANGYLAALHVPVNDSSGRFNGTLGGAVYLSQIEEKYLQDIKFARNGFVVLFDDNGDILYHPRDDLIAQNISKGEAASYYDDNLRSVIGKAGKEGGTGTFRYKAGGEERLAAYESIEVVPGHRWVAMVTVPVTEAEAALTTVGLDNGFLAFTVVLVVAIFAIAAAMLLGRMKSLELEEAKDEFLQLATHQLQTPVTGMKIFLSLLLDEKGGKLTAKQREMAQGAYDANERERIIINDLLNVARLESGRLVLQKSEVDLGDLVTAAAKGLESIMKGRQQVFEVKAEPVKANVDPERLRMVVDNLLSNASKYTPEGGRVVVGNSEDKGGVIIYVRDSGVGIAKSDIPKLFKKFSRVPNPLSEKVGGTGLGLYLVKKIVEMHGGQLDVESSAGEGTTFKIRLPK
jgi:signal transduction histidine kinase